jgi:hypothetical protein
MADAASKPEPADAEFAALVEVFRILLRWDEESRRRGQGDEIRTAAPEPRPR